MKALIQRVKEASVSIEGRSVASIGTGIVVLLGITHSDNADIIEKGADKCVNLRIFEDSSGKMNLSLKDISGEALIVSQFTLYGDCRRGRRPSYTEAAMPEYAEKLYEQFIKSFIDRGIKTQTGRFGAMMDVSLVNSGPVTLMVEI
jgi:D-tyrosyl-tRNA(Tyr) deacylase